MRILSTKTIYLDHAAATPLDEKVVSLMSSVQKKLYGNPSAIHTEGVKARTAIENARKEIAELFFAHSDEIIFTGSGTESDVLAIRGVITNYQLLITNGNAEKGIPHIVTTTIEHPAVLETIRFLEKNKQVEVSYIDCNEKGIVNPKDIKSALKENTVLVSVMYVNNEIGTIQPITEIAKEIRHFKKQRNSKLYPFFHTDAAQAINYLPIDNIEKLGVDLLSFNSSKIYGPKGLGVLYKKRHIVLSPLYIGGGQEYGLRGGTENTASIVGTAFALQKTIQIKEKESKRLTILRDEAISKLLSLSGVSGYEITLNGDTKERLANNINISIDGISSELLVIELDARGIFVSSKSACKADDPDESYVIAALRYAEGAQTKPDEGSLRISLGRSTTKKDLDALVRALKQILAVYKKWK